MKAENNYDLSFKALCTFNPISATTAMYRRALIPILDDSFKTVPLEDWILWLMYAKKGKVRVLNDITAVYRIHAKSAYAGIDEAKRLIWRFNVRVYIWQNFSFESKSDFFQMEFYGIKKVLVSNSISKTNKTEFLNILTDLGFVKWKFIMSFLIQVNSQMLNRVLIKFLRRINSSTTNVIDELFLMMKIMIIELYGIAKKP